jgi:hypothetical protein
MDVNLIEQHQAAHQKREGLRQGDSQPEFVRVVEWVDCCPCCMGAPILEGHEKATRIFCACRLAWPNPLTSPKKKGGR